MIKTKSDDLSVNHKIDGNSFYQKGKFSEALEECNKALNFAVSNENLALAYANRSAVFIELKKYRKCLQNIEWAIEHGYPEDKHEKLLERREKCRKIIDENFVKEEEAIKDFFKLSYPPNPKIPFIVDCLEMKMTKNCGRGIFATRDLKAGDIISIERPILGQLGKGSEYSNCCWCMSSRKGNLIPCTKTASLMFCSTECRDEVYGKFKEEDFWCLIEGGDDGLHRRLLCTFEAVFGGKENLIKFARENNLAKWKNTIFDYDLSDPSHPKYRENQLRSILSLSAPFNYKSNKKQNSESIARVVGGNSFYQELIEHVAVVWQTCVSSISKPRDSSAENLIDDFQKVNESSTNAYRFDLFPSLMNYACFPNVMKFITDAETILYVTRPIKAGEELLRHAAIPEFFKEDVETRRMHLLNNCSFYCMCYYCQKGLTVASLPGFQMPPYYLGDDFNTVKQKIAKVMQIFEDIEKFEARSKIGTFNGFYISVLNYKIMLHLGDLIEY